MRQALSSCAHDIRRLARHIRTAASHRDADVCAGQRRHIIDAVPGHRDDFTFGLKLPTGKYDVTNDEGEQAERTLQPGTGTTDLLLGYYWNSGAPLLGLSWTYGAFYVTT